MTDRSFLCHNTDNILRYSPVKRLSEPQQPFISAQYLVGQIADFWESLEVMMDKCSKKKSDMAF